MIGRGRLSTHVLDTAAGRPAEGLAVNLVRLCGEIEEMVVSVRTNADGRTDAPLLEAEAMERGTYELRFHAGDYLRAAGHPLSDPPFLDLVPVRFSIADPDAPHHVPLLLSPYGYSTYRGS